MNNEQFSRHLRLPYFGIEGQEKISRSKVFIAGAGGLGSPSAIYLASAGVGSIGLVDNDTVEISNLPRQILHNPSTLNELKTISAEKRLKQINPDIKLDLFPETLNANNINIIKDYDVVIDATDNFATKFLLNDACIIQGIPLIHGGVLRYTGQVMTIVPHQSACYRCIFPEPPPANTIPTCEQAGILNTVAGIIGLIQATEVIKLIIGAGSSKTGLHLHPVRSEHSRVKGDGNHSNSSVLDASNGAGNLLTNRLLVFDALEMSFRNIEIKRSNTCPVCSKQATIKTIRDTRSGSGECCLPR